MAAPKLGGERFVNRSCTSLLERARSKDGVDSMTTARGSTKSVRSAVISPALARRIALAAQGFGAPPPAQIGVRQLTTLVKRIELLQIDSINVFERSHYLPAFSRLGPYDKTQLDRLTTDCQSHLTVMMYRPGPPVLTDHRRTEAAFMTTPRSQGPFGDDSRMR